MDAATNTQLIELSAPPLTQLPRWGRRLEFDDFFVELVPRGKRVFNVRLHDTFASMSYSGARGTSSLAGDRLRRYERLPFEYIVAPPRFPLKGETKIAPEVLVFVLQFDRLRATLAGALDVPAESLDPQVVIGNPTPFNTALAKKLRLQLNLPSPASHYVHSLCIALLVEMFRPITRRDRAQRKPGSVKTTISMVLGYIDANLEHDLALPTLAALAGLTETQLSRQFKSEVGESPHNYVIQQRTEAARSLLSSDHSLAKIAYATGFSSQSHMTTAFKKVLGVTPGALRKRTQRANS